MLTMTAPKSWADRKAWNAMRGYGEGLPPLILRWGSILAFVVNLQWQEQFSDYEWRTEGEGNEVRLPALHLGLRM